MLVHLHVYTITCLLLVVAVEVQMQVNETMLTWNIKHHVICDQICICYTKRNKVFVAADDDNDISVHTLSIDCSLQLYTLYNDAVGAYTSYEMPIITSDLDLSRNNINESLHQTFKRRVRVDGCRLLQTLDLSRNKIIELRCDDFLDVPTTIRKLDLSENLLTSIHDNTFHRLVHLHELDLSFNRLTRLPDGRLWPNHLQVLSVSYNPLGDYILNVATTSSLFNGLVVLRAENTSLTRMPYNVLTNNGVIQELYLSENSLIGDMSGALPQSLRVLDVSGLNLSTVRANVLVCPHLRHLYMNRMYHLVHIDSYAFYYLNSIESIYLDNCIHLSGFNDLAFGIDKLTETYPDHTLRRLSVQNCALTTFNRSMQHFLRRIHQLNLYGNPWHCDCDLYQLFNDNDNKTMTMTMTMSMSMMKTSRNIRCYTPVEYKYKSLMNDNDQLHVCNLLDNVSIRKRVFNNLNGVTIVLIMLFLIILIIASIIIYNYSATQTNQSN